MSLTDLYDSGFRQRNADHFAAIVRVAMSDGIITEEEQTFLDRLAQRLEINPETYKAILKDYKSYPINPPVSYDKRIARLYDLSRMVFADNTLGEKQAIILARLAVGLGFSTTNVEYIVDKALKLVAEGVDSEDFEDSIKNMNR
ncbi:MAG: TerB family tellurite resistance protein [Flavobacteriaceae bacterium]|nr:TerB family tellurite resistance protein [Flavobacteriaceae bacterium]